MSARSRLIRLCSATVVSAFIAGAVMLTAPTAFAVEAGAPATEQGTAAVQAVAPGTSETAPATGTESEGDPAQPTDPVTPVEPAAPVDPVAPVDPAVPGETAPESPEAQEPEAPAETPAVDSTEPGIEEDPAELPPADTSTDSTPEAPSTGTQRGKMSDAKEAADKELQVTAGSLEWGVKQSFRNYIYNFAMFEGQSRLLGKTIAQPESKGVFKWSAGSGSAASTGAKADVAFGEGVGVHFQSHPMTVDGSEVFALDLAFTNPRVVITSPSSGELRLDVSGREFIGMTEAGDPFVLNDVAFAKLTLPHATVEGDSITWTEAEATLTEEGSVAFGGFYQAGEELDPITFSTTGGGSTPNPNPNPAPTATSVKIEASKSSVVAGGSIKLTSSITPKAAAGSVQFFNGKSKLGAPVPASNGVATLSTTKLPVGNHEISAEFTPTDTKAFAGSATTKSAQVRVVAKPAGPVSGPVANATLTWGVKESFRKYVVGPIAHGTISTLGSTTQASGNGVFGWTGGTGTAMSDGSKANVSYGAGNGLYLQGHGMTVNGKQAFALDMALTNPRVVITSATKGEIRMDVSGREFADMTSVGPEIDLKQVVIATLDLPAPSAKGKTLTWTAAPATLTDAGSKALGEFYSAGEALDSATFSLPMSTAVSTKKATSTTLKASATTIKDGAAVSLTASVKPNLIGTVVFTASGKQLGGAVKVANGQAKTTIKPAAGVHSITAAFTPDSASYGRSVSNTVKVTVEKTVKNPDVAPPASEGGQAAGSLSWGVSTAFADYVTGPIAKGEVTTSGVGSSGGAYLFPQVSGGDWNVKTQTGSVQYSGVVTYTGHHGLLREGVSNPMIQVTGPTTAVLYSGGAQWATLDLGSASKSVGANGEVTWSGVPVNGGFSGGASGGGSYTLPADGLSFTVGAAGGASYGSTSVSNASKKRTVAETAPTTTGIRILTAPDQITAGGELEFEAEGFEAGEREMIVALYPGLIVLDEAAGANDAGTVRWLGTLPEDIEPGEYTITVQGSADAGAVFTVVDEKDAKAAKKKAAEAKSQITDGVNGEAVAAAGVVPIATGPSWLWWVGAGALALIAAAMGGLVAVQRRAGTQS